MMIIIIFILIFFFIWASADIRSGVYLRCLCRGSSKERVIALTFDDGPHPIYTPKILDILRENNIKATFFLIGSKAETWPDIVKQIHDDGHLIGNHTYSHSVFYPFWNSNRIYEDVQKNNDIIFKIIGRRPIIFRPPFGVTNPLIRKAVKSSFKCIGWSVRSFDTLACLKRDSIGERIAHNIKNGDIVLLHDNREKSDFLLSFVIERIKEKKMKVVSLDQLIKINTYEI